MKKTFITILFIFMIIVTTFADNSLTRITADGAGTVTNGINING